MVRCVTHHCASEVVKKKFIVSTFFKVIEYVKDSKIKYVI